MTKLLRTLMLILLAAMAHEAMAAEKLLDFSETPVDTTPTNFTSIVSREGKPGVWQVIKDDVKTTFAPLTPNGGTRPKQNVLAQLSEDRTDEHYPILLYDGDTYSDFTFTTKFKIVSGRAERMAGIVFRAQDGKNFYVLRASALGNNFRFYKVVEGNRGDILGPSMEISAGEWHEMSVKCTANTIQCFLDGKQAIPDITDNSFSVGKIGFWTKSDSISYFTDAKVTYTPRESLAQVLVKDVMSQYPHFLGLKIFAPVGATNNYQVVAATDAAEMKKKASDVAARIISENSNGYKVEPLTKKSVSVTLPLHDRNGDTVAAVEVVLVPFFGQTDQSFYVRAHVATKYMEQHFKSLKDLLE